MLEEIGGGVIESVIRVTGWGVLKIVTLGRYHGFREKDLIAEGAIGFATISGLSFLAYSLWAA